MKTLTLTNENKTAFTFELNDSEFVQITVTKENGASAKYQTYKTNCVKDGSILVCRENGTWVQMPVEDSAAVNYFLKQRTLHSFESIADLREFQNSNETGASFQSNDLFCVYTYSK